MSANLVEIAVGAAGRVPQVALTREPVAALVHAAHETAVADAVAAWQARGGTSDALDAILVYCAERRCADQAATCPGCRRRTEEEGSTSLDRFVSRHARIEFAASDVEVKGPGTASARFHDLDDLTRRWAGEEYWFWARRVLRKLRHGVRRAHIAGSPVAGEGETPAVILMEPQLPENIGMVARAMANFGLDELRLIAPRDGWPNEKARVAASGANYVIDDARAYADLASAVGDLNFIAATTARQRDLRKPVLTPRAAIAELKRRIEAGERVGLLFGRERNGLETDEVAGADVLVMIPVNSRFASLNLAQAVLLLGYEWIEASGRATLGRVTTYEQPLAEGLYLGEDRPATKEELFGFFSHLEGALDERSFFNPPERRPTVVRNIRTLFTRLAPTAQEVRTLRGIIAAFTKRRPMDPSSGS
ncbi:MAG: RNA methyltransferase [Hyphomicrobiaceae bacterium]|nr:RNA methyltransferase [Hyphomicrobiaceae bacterium]